MQDYASARRAFEEAFSLIPPGDEHAKEKGDISFEAGDTEVHFSFGGERWICELEGYTVHRSKEDAAEEIRRRNQSQKKLRCERRFRTEHSEVRYGSKNIGECHRHNEEITYWTLELNIQK